MINNGIVELNKGLATIGLAIACVGWMHYTHGASGIGWFIFGLFIIW